MGKVLHSEFFGACLLHYYLNKDYDELCLEYVRDADDECINSVHFEKRATFRGVSHLEALALRKRGILDRCERTRKGTQKLYLRYQTPAGRLLEGVFETDGRSLYGITVYEVPPLRHVA